MIEINLVPEDIQDMQLEESICQALSLTGTPVSAGDLEACHRMRRRDRVIVKFSSRKKRNDVIFKKKSLNGESDELKNLGFTSAKLFISDSMFFSSCIFVKVGENSDATKIKQFATLRRH